MPEGLVLYLVAVYVKKTDLGSVGIQGRTRSRVRGSVGVTIQERSDLMA